MKLEYRVISDRMAFLYKVPIDGKIDNYMTEFVRKEPAFYGTVTVFKDTRYFEENGDVHQRQFEYEVERGKYRKKRYSNPLNWKVV